jgi:hypothetical protein
MNTSTAASPTVRRLLIDFPIIYFSLKKKNSIFNLLVIVDENQNIEAAAGEQNDSVQQSNVEHATSNEGASPVQTEQPTTEKQNQSAENAINQNATETQTMEVHHPHHPTHKKKWGEYLLEFFMLFLAVFLGFLAENFREHLVEKEKIQQYMHTMVENLKYDTTRCGGNRKRNMALESRLDSFRADINRAIKGEINANKLYYDYLSVGRSFNHAAFNTAALTQMQSSGTLRLVKNDVLINEMLDYYNRKTGVTERIYGEGHEAMMDLLNSCKNFFSNEFLVNAHKRNGVFAPDSAHQAYFKTILLMQPAPKLLKTRPEELMKLYNDVATFEDNVERYDDVLQWMQLQASGLIIKIDDAYHSKGERYGTEINNR